MVRPVTGGRRIAGLSLSKQLNSWFKPYGDSSYPGLIAQIFFPTDVSDLDNNDRMVLDALFNEYSIHLLGHKIHFTFVGHADLRGTEPYNYGLSTRRAKSVQSYVRNSLSSYDYFSSSVVAFGEIGASTNSLAGDRRVDIICSYVPKKRIQLKPIMITGTVPKKTKKVPVQWVEIFSYVSQSPIMTQGGLESEYSNLPTFLIFEKYADRDASFTAFDKNQIKSHSYFYSQFIGTSMVHVHVKRFQIKWRKRKFSDRNWKPAFKFLVEMIRGSDIGLDPQTVDRSEELKGKDIKIYKDWADFRKRNPEQYKKMSGYQGTNWPEAGKQFTKGD